jgi:hypothetical protein
MENFEPGQGKDAARELAEHLSVSARRAVELYYLESLTQAVAISEGPLKVRRKSESGLFSIDDSLEIQKLKSDVTGCYNKVGFALLLECELERARRRQSPLSLALFKLDPPNDDLVREVAKQGRECCRLLDSVVPPPGLSRPALNIDRRHPSDTTPGTVVRSRRVDRLGPTVRRFHRPKIHFAAAPPTGRTLAARERRLEHIFLFRRVGL